MPGTLPDSLLQPTQLNAAHETEEPFQPDWDCNRLLEGNCLELLDQVPDHSVHLILCDLPYGTTQNRWDSTIDLELLWPIYKRVLAPRGAIVLTSQGPFTARLILSNERWFKFKITWIKSKATNFLNCRRQPLRRHEDICVFYPRQPVYSPQMQPGAAYDKGVRKDQLTGSYGDFEPVRVQTSGGRFPTDVVYFKTAESEGPVWHATQKPVALGRYLIRTYSQPGHVVLDNTSGAGSFLVAALLEGRNFFGVELNDNVLFKKEPIDLIGVTRKRLDDAWKVLPAERRAQITRCGLLSGCA